MGRQQGMAMEGHGPTEGLGDAQAFGEADAAPKPCWARILSIIYSYWSALELATLHYGAYPDRRAHTNRHVHIGLNPLLVF